MAVVNVTLVLIVSTADELITSCDQGIVLTIGWSKMSSTLLTPTLLVLAARAGSFPFGKDGVGRLCPIPLR